MDDFLVALEHIEQAITGGERVIRVTGPTGAGKSEHLRALCRRRQIPLVRLRHDRAPSSAQALYAEMLREVEPTAMGGDGEGRVTPEHAVVAALRRQPSPLFAFDDVEALGEDALQGWLPDAIERLLRWVDGLQVVVASRLPIPALGEVRVEVRPLDTQARGGQPSEAARFFRHVAERRLAGRSVERSPRADGWIEQIVSALRGLRVAIEQVVSRLLVCSLEELARQSPRELFEFAGDPYEETMRDTARVIWVGLTRAQRQVLAGLALFADAFGSKAVARVGEVASPRDAERLLFELTRQCLVWPVGEGRFILDPSLRACALEETPAAVLDAHWVLHADWFLSRGVEHARRAIGAAGDGEQVRQAARGWLSQAQPELSAIADRARSSTPPDVRRLHQALLCLSPLPTFRLSEREAFEALRQALALGDEAVGETEPGVVGELRRLFGRACRYREASLDRASGILEQARADAERAGDVLLGARVKTAQVEVCNLERRLDDAEALCRQALAIYEGEGVHGWVGISLCQLGRIHAERFEPAAARGCWSRSLDALVSVGDRAFELLVRNHLVSLELEALDVDAARGEARRVVELSVELGLARDEVVARGYLVFCDHLGGGEAAALVEAYGEVIERFEALGEPRFVLYYRYYQALVMLEVGRWARAEVVLSALEECEDARYRAMARNARCALRVYRGDQEAVEAPGAALAGPLEGLVDVQVGAQHLAAGRLEAAARCWAALRSSGNDEVRLVGRVLGAWLAEARRWVFAADGTGFKAPGRSWTAIKPSRQMPIRLLSALVRAHVDGAEFVSRAQLHAECWPDEPRSDVTSRLTTTVSELRQVFKSLGLPAPFGNVWGKGYRIEPDLTVEVVEGGEGAP